MIRLSWDTWRLAALDKRLTIALLVLLLLAGAGLRFHNLGSQSLWRDEAISWHYVRDTTLPNLVSTLIDDELHPPLWYIVLYLDRLGLGQSEFSLRFQAALSSLLLIPLGYVLGKRLFSPALGLINALLVALSPFLLRYAQEARSYSFLALLAAASFYALCRWQSRPTTRRTLVFSVVMAAALYTHHWAFFLLVAFNLCVLLWIVWGGGQGLLSKWLLANALIAVLYLPWLPILLQQLSYDTSWMYSHEPPAQLLWLTFRAWTASWRATPFFLLLIALAVLVAITPWFFGAARLRRPDAQVLAVLIVCLIPIVSAIALSQRKPIYKPDRYTIIVYPAFSLLLASGLAALRRPVLVAIAVCLVAGLWLRKDITDLSTATFSTARDAAAYVSSDVGPQDVLVFAPDPIGQSFDYYYAGDQFSIGYANWDGPRRWHIATWVDAWFEPGILDRTLAQIDSHLADGACLWLVYTPGPIAVPGAEHAVEELRQSLGARYTLRHTEVFPEMFEYMDVDRYCGRAVDQS